MAKELINKVTGPLYSDPKGPSNTSLQYGTLRAYP